jgi:hypothetical protein
MIETDTSNYVSGRILSQYDFYRILPNVAYFSTKYSPEGYNYIIYEAELLAVIHAFEE